MPMIRSTAVVAAAAAALTLPAAASAHVTVNPRELTAGSYSIMNVRVPNERDDKGTRTVDLRLPAGFYSVSYKKVAGWKVKVTRSKLTRPVKLGDDFEVDEQVTRIVWTTSRRQGRDHRARSVRGVPALGPRAGRPGRLHAAVQGLPDLRGRGARALVEGEPRSRHSRAARAVLAAPARTAQQQRG
jgi:hypothetical protein